MKIRTALRTNQIAGFVTVPAWKKMLLLFCIVLNYILLYFIFLYCPKLYYYYILLFYIVGWF